MNVFPRNQSTGLGLCFSGYILRCKELPATEVRKIWFYKSVMIYLNVKKPDL